MTFLPLYQSYLTSSILEENILLRVLPQSSLTIIQPYSYPTKICFLFAFSAATKLPLLHYLFNQKKNKKEKKKKKTVFGNALFY